MKVKQLLETLNSLPADRMEDDVSIWIEDGDRYDLDSVDESIDGIIELNVKQYQHQTSTSYVVGLLVGHGHTVETATELVNKIKGIE
jgi:hypothetical protein